MWSATITREAPDDNERKISIILGSNVSLVDCRITSLLVTENLDLKSKKAEIFSLQKMKICENRNVYFYTL